MLRRRPAKVLTARLAPEAQRRAELALFAAAATFACLASLVSLLLGG
ncbi:MAG: hypothetical protein M3020_03075 [Myxococcota bacterium]|jgi:hypothetical protein|nr:hypothetical protein [Myxococcota bacterium]